MKYVKLYFTYAKSSLMSDLVYSANAIIGLIAFLLMETASLFTLFILVSAVPSIDGYSIWQIGFLFGMTNLAVGLDHLFTDRLWDVAYYEVKQGKLDHVFLRPVPILFQILASRVQLEALGELIVAIALMIFCGARITFAAGIGGVLLALLGVIAAAIIISSFKIFVASLAFKFKRSGPLLQFIYGFTGYIKYPLRIYPKFIQGLLTFVIPLGLCVFYPFENLFAPIPRPWLVALAIIGATALFATICISIWNALAKRYESTGS